MSKPSDITADHMLGVFDGQFAAAGMPRPKLDISSPSSSGKDPLTTVRPAPPDRKNNRRLKILQITRVDYMADLHLRSLLTKYLEREGGSLFPALHFGEYLHTKYGIPVGAELLEIVDVSKVMAKKDILFVLKFRHLDWPVVPDGDLIPVFNPTVAAEEPRRIVGTSRRKSIITI